MIHVVAPEPWADVDHLLLALLREATATHPEEVLGVSYQTAIFTTMRTLHFLPSVLFSVSTMGTLLFQSTITDSSYRLFTTSSTLQVLYFVDSF